MSKTPYRKIPTLFRSSKLENFTDFLCLMNYEVLEDFGWVGKRRESSQNVTEARPMSHYSSFFLCFSSRKQRENEESIRSGKSSHRTEFGARPIPSWYSLSEYLKVKTWNYIRNSLIHDSHVTMVLLFFGRWKQATATSNLLAPRISAL